MPGNVKNMSKGLQAVKTLPVSSIEELTKLLREACAGGNTSILPGMERPLPKDSQGLKQAIFLDLSKMDKVIEHSCEDQVIKVETGLSVNKLNAYLAQSSQWFPVSAYDDSVTILDVINSGDGGPLDHGFGGPRQLVLGLDVALASGEVTKCGGRVVKNVTGYDLAKLFIGSWQTLGVPYAAYLRLYAKPESEKTLVWLENDAKVLVDLAGILTRSGLPISCLELVDSHLLYDLNQDETAYLNKLGVVLHQRQAALLVRMDGHDVEVDELVAEAMLLGNQKKLKGQEIEAKLAQGMWTKLANAALSLKAQSIEAAIDWGRLAKVVEKWRSNHKFVLWQARPALSLFKLFAQDAQTALELKQSLHEFLTVHGEGLSMAYADVQLERKFEFANMDVTAVEDLKNALKDKFDPEGCLNPLVSL